MFVELFFFTEGGESLYFRRTYSKKEERYTINRKPIPKDEYRKMLKSKNIDSLQGFFWLNQSILTDYQIDMMDDLCMKTGIEIRDLFENLSGSIEYKQEYERMGSRLMEIREEKKELTEQIKGHRRLFKNSKLHISNLDAFKSLSNDFEELTIAKILAQYLEIDVVTKSAKRRIDKIIKDIKQKESDSSKLSQELRNIMMDKTQSDELMNAIRNYDQEYRKIGSLQVERSIKERKIREVQADVDGTKKVIEIHNKRMAEALESKSTIESQILAARTKIQSINSVNSFDARVRVLIQNYIKEMRLRQDFEEAKLGKQIEANIELISSKRDTIENLKTSGQEKESSLINIERRLSGRKRELDNYLSKREGLRNELNELEIKYSDLDYSKTRIEKLRKEIEHIEILEEGLRSKLGETSTHGELIKYLFASVSGFRGVFGDLVKPINERFDLAKSLLMGKTKDYLIVDNSKAAEIVNDILRERFIQKTVVTLDTVPLVSKQSMNSFRSIISGLGSAAFDIVYAEDSDLFIEPAINYFLNNKVCCENMDKANRLREILGRNPFIVTIYGDIIKGKTMRSIGDPKSFGLTKSTKKEVQARIDKLRERRKEVVAQLESLVKEEDEQKMRELKIRLSELDLTIRALETDIEVEQEKKVATNKAKREIVAQNRLLETEISELEQINLPLIEKQSKLNAKRIKKEKEILEAILEANKVQSPKEIIDITLNYVNNDFKSQFDLTSHISSLTSRIHSLNIPHLTASIEDLTERLSVKSDQLAELTLEISKLEESLSETRSSLNSLDDKKNVLKKEVESTSTLQTTLRHSLQTIASDIDDLRAEARRLDCQIVGLEGKKENALMEQELEGIDVQPGNYELLFKRVMRGDDLVVLEDVEQAQNVDEFLEMITPQSVQTLRKVLAEKHEEASREINKHCSKFFNDEFVEKEKAKSVDLRKKIKEAQDKVKEIMDREQRINNDLKKIKFLRNDKIMNLFTKVSVRVNNAYKHLTGNREAAVSFYFENHLDPCDGQLKYEPTPPVKKFVFDRTTLSGGERAIASMALYFSICEAMEIPLLMLDEADSPLDPVNASIYSIFMKRVAEKRQVVIVSHNFNVFKRSKMMLGIAYGERDVGAECFSYKLDAN